MSREELGKEKAKKLWEENRDSDLNQRVVAELSEKEKKNEEYLKIE